MALNSNESKPWITIQIFLVWSFDFCILLFLSHSLIKKVCFCSSMSWISQICSLFFGKPFLVQLRTLVSRCIYWSFSLSFLLLQIDRASECKLGFDSTRVAALLVLAISAPLSHEQHVCSIPPRIFSYAVTLLGRIARALTDVIDQNALLTYLSRCSISTTISATEFNIKIPNDTSNEIMRMPMELAAPLGGYQLEVHDEVIDRRASCRERV